MHYCCLVFTREKPEDEIIIEALRPFNEDDYFDKPEKERDPGIPFVYDFFSTGGGGRFHGVLAMEGESEEEAKKARRWYASLQEPLDAEYVLRRSFCYVDPDGKGYARSRFDYAKKRWIGDPQYDERGKKIFQTRKDCYVTVVDIHD